MKITRRFNLLALTLIIFLSMNLPLALATGAGYIQADSQTGKPGDTVLITVSIPDAKGFAGVQFSVTYDNRYFTINEADADGDGNSDAIRFASQGFNMNAVTVFNQKGRVNFAMIRGSAEPFEKSTEVKLVGIDFTIKENCPNGTYPINIISCLADGGGIQVPIGTPESGSITVEGSTSTTTPTTPATTSKPAPIEKPNPTPQPAVQTPVQNPSPIVKSNPGLTDISGHWAEANIINLVSSGVIKGYPDNTFRPDKTISRAEFTILLVKALKLPAQSGKVFEDTANHWAQDYIATAQYYGFVGGISDTMFAPDSPITREQMAVMVVKATNLKAAGTPKVFADDSKISSWAREAVNIASGNNIISGYQNNTFRPAGNTTRAEAVTVLAKSLEHAPGK